MSGLCLCFMKQGSDSVSNISMQTIPIVNEKTGRKFNSCKESGFRWGKKYVSGSVTNYNDITEKELMGKQLQKAYIFYFFYSFYFIRFNKHLWDV